MIKYITAKDYERIQKLARIEAKKIPSAHCRKREEKEQSSIISAVKETRDRKSGKPTYLLLVENYNQGTSRFPHWIKRTYLIASHEIVETSRKQRDGRVVCRINGYLEDKVLAVIK